MQDTRCGMQVGIRQFGHSADGPGAMLSQPRSSKSGIVLDPDPVDVPWELRGRAKRWGSSGIVRVAQGSRPWVLWGGRNGSWQEA